MRYFITILLLVPLLKTRDEMNEKLVELVKPKWYESQYLWLGIGFILGKI